MIVVIAQAKIQESKRDEIVAAIRTLAEKSRVEPGCLDYQVVESLEASNHFLMIERWDERASLDAHIAAPHVQAFLAAVVPCLAAPPSQEVFNVASVERLM